MRVPEPFRGLVDDAAIFPPGDLPLSEAIAAHVGHRGAWYADLVGTLVVRDTDLGIAPNSTPLSVVIGTGAGGVSAAAALATRRGLDVAGLEVALRDLDDLPGNAHRIGAAVDSARAAGDLAEETAIFVELPATAPGLPGHGWLAAADVAAEAGFRLKFRTGGLHQDQFPGTAELAGWVDAALDRETPFKCTAGLHRAVRHQDGNGWWRHGFLNLLAGTCAAWDGADPDTVAHLLEETDPAALTRIMTADAGLAARTGRRWFASFGSCSIDEPLEDLVRLELVEQP